MARSLDAQHDELAQTNPLLNRFLLLAVLWMAMAAFAAMAVDGPPTTQEIPTGIIE